MTRPTATLRRIVTLLVIIAVPLFALGETKRRAVAPHAPELATLSGTVTDSSTGAPVAGVQIFAGSQTAGVTDAKGQFSVKIPVSQSVVLTFSRAGYATLTSNVTISGDATRAFQMSPKPVTNVRLVDGTTVQLDTDTIQFGYLAPFSGYVADTKVNLCTTGGNSFIPDRADIQKITAAAQLNDATCCSRGAIPAINVQLKNGTSSTGGFVDACFGYTEDVIGHDHNSGQAAYIHFSNIAEIDFP